MKIMQVIFIATFFAGIYCGTILNSEKFKYGGDIADLDKINLTIDPNDEYKLDLVQTIFRHGDRIPDKDEIYKTDPHDEIYRNFGYGELTKTGMKREYRIGQVLRKRYAEYLEGYEQRDIHAYSTNVDRTKMSLQLLLSALFPPRSNDLWSNDILWDPIPTHTNDFGIGFLNAFSCPKFEDTYKEVGQSQEIKDKLKKYEYFYEFLRNSTKITTFSPTSVFMIYNNIRSGLSLGLDLPDWCSLEKYKTLVEIAPIAMRTLTHTDFMKRTMGGLLIERILDNIEHQEQGSDRKKIYLYGGHDLNIASFTNVHNITNVPVVPDFGSTIVIELLKKKNSTDNKHYIRMFMWTGAGEQWIPMKMNNCETPCSLDKYKKLTYHLLPDDAVRDCISVTSLCARPVYMKELDFPYEIERLLAGPDLESFKYGGNFTSTYQMRKQNLELMNKTSIL